MEKLKEFLKRAFCLPPRATVLFALFGYGSVLAVAVFSVQNPVAQYVSYVASAYALVVTVTGLPYVKTVARRVKEVIANHPLTEKIRSTALGERFMTDIRFRTGVALYRSFFINLLYIVMKLAAGVYFRSAWFISLAVYYALLAGMRLALVRRVRVQDEALEMRRYRLCGVMLLLMNQALAGIVAFIVHQNRGFHYPGLLIYAMALYSFYAVISAVVNAVKTRRHNSPILSAARVINLVAAMVSILSLETAMLSAFGGGGAADMAFRRTITGATGGAVCCIVIVMAVYMIVRASKNLKRINVNNQRPE